VAGEFHRTKLAAASEGAAASVQSRGRSPGKRELDAVQEMEIESPKKEVPNLSTFVAKGHKDMGGNAASSPTGNIGASVLEDEDIGSELMMTPALAAVIFPENKEKNETRQTSQQRSISRFREEMLLSNGSLPLAREGGPLVIPIRSKENDRDSPSMSRKETDQSVSNYHIPGKYPHIKDTRKA